MVELASGWNLNVERGPDWLFVRIHCDDADPNASPSLAEAIWSLLKDHFTRRIVVECDQVPLLNSGILSELLKLRSMINSENGMMRLSGLSPVNRRVLRTMKLENELPVYSDRNAAVMGGQPVKPR